MIIKRNNSSIGKRIKKHWLAISASVIMLFSGATSLRANADTVRVNEVHHFPSVSPTFVQESQAGKTTRLNRVVSHHSHTNTDFAAAVINRANAIYNRTIGEATTNRSNSDLQTQPDQRIVVTVSPQDYETKTIPSYHREVQHRSVKFPKLTHHQPLLNDEQFILQHPVDPIDGDKSAIKPNSFDQRRGRR